MVKFYSQDVRGNKVPKHTVLGPGLPLTISVTKGIAVARPRGKSLKWLMLAALAVLTAALAPQARAEGLFDFLFGGFQPRPPAPPATRSYIEPLPPVAPPSLGSESVRGGGGGGRAVAFCVRLCDGQHFPMEHITNATPVETCRAMCPASRTKVYFGNEIGGAVSRDGARYADLDNAFLYRKQLVANCTCNGRDAFGLAPFDLSSDPTLRPGDIVATKDGFAAFTGKSAKGDSFAPVKPSSVSSQLNAAARKQPNQPLQPVEAPIDDDPGTIAMPQPAAPPISPGAGQTPR